MGRSLETAQLRVNRWPSLVATELRSTRPTSRSLVTAPTCHLALVTWSFPHRHLQPLVSAFRLLHSEFPFRPLPGLFPLNHFNLAALIPVSNRTAGRPHPVPLLPFPIPL